MLIQPFDGAAREAADRLLRERRTVHEFDGRTPLREVVLEALDLARYAPNHKLTNPWKWYWLGRRTIEKVCGPNARRPCGSRRVRRRRGRSSIAGSSCRVACADRTRERGRPGAAPGGLTRRAVARRWS
ncbi:MAG: nitroreductase family protein [Planctomycetota bacterium]